MTTDASTATNPTTTDTDTTKAEKGADAGAMASSRAKSAYNQTLMALSDARVDFADAVIDLTQHHHRTDTPIPPWLQAANDFISSFSALALAPTSPTEWPPADIERLATKEPKP